MKFFKPQSTRYKFILKNMKPGSSIDLGGRQGEMHDYLVKYSKYKILSVDLEKGDIVADLNNMFPIKDNVYDNVIVGEVIEHIYNSADFLKECRRILKPKGHLILTTPNMTGIPYLLNDKVGEGSGIYTPHIHAFNMHMMKYLFRQAGFEVTKTKYNNAFYSKNLLLRFIGFLIPKLRPTLMVVGVKA